jgi:hypothetical protein
VGPHSRTSEYVTFPFGGGEIVLYLRTLLKWGLLRDPVYFHLVSPSPFLLSQAVSFPQWAHQPTLKSVCCTRKRSHKRQVFGVPPPPRRVLGHARWERYCFLFFVEVVPVLQELTI